MSSRRVSLDLHPIYNKGSRIEEELDSLMEEAVKKKVRVVEIITGKGSGQLRKRVLRFLDSSEVKRIYHRIEKDQHNHGRILVHFRWR